MSDVDTPKPHFLDQFGEKLKNIAMKIKHEDDELYESDELHGVQMEVFKGFKKWSCIQYVD